MKQLLTLSLLAAFLCSNCNNNPTNTTEKPATAEVVEPEKKQEGSAGSGLWKGTFSNGLTGATISFEVAGNELKDLTFEGYWRCDGRLDLTTVGPEGSYQINNGKVNGVLTEPEGGAAPFRFELQGNIGSSEAEGTFRMMNVQAGCDTYKLNWTAKKQ